MLKSCRVSAQAGGLMADLADLAEAALGFGGAPACDPPTGTPAAAPRRPQVGQGVARFVKPRRFQKPDRCTYLTVLPVSPPSSSAKLSTRHGSSAARAPALCHEREGRSICRAPFALWPEMTCQKNTHPQGSRSFFYPPCRLHPNVHNCSSDQRPPKSPALRPHFGKSIRQAVPIIGFRFQNTRQGWPWQRCPAPITDLVEGET
jgi:hypothetical protein